LHISTTFTVFPSKHGPQKSGPVPKKKKKLKQTTDNQKISSELYKRGGIWKHPLTIQVTM
jgi:hypothetical protein